jgi:hypothetical protein
MILQGIISAIVTHRPYRRNIFSSDCQSSLEMSPSSASNLRWLPARHLHTFQLATAHRCPVQRVLLAGVLNLRGHYQESFDRKQGYPPTGAAAGREINLFPNLSHRD